MPCNIKFIIWNEAGDTEILLIDHSCACCKNRTAQVIYGVQTLIDYVIGKTKHCGCDKMSNCFMRKIPWTWIYVSFIH